MLPSKGTTGGNARLQLGGAVVAVEARHDQFHHNVCAAVLLEARTCELQHRGRVDDNSGVYRRVFRDATEEACPGQIREGVDQVSPSFPTSKPFSCVSYRVASRLSPRC